MIAGHLDTGHAHNAGWPRVSSRLIPPDWHSPPIARCHAIPASIPTFSRIPENYGIRHDASWCPNSGRCGGAVALFCPNTLRDRIYPVNIPLRLDNAYTAELYTTWVASSAWGTSTKPTFTFGSSSWHFAHCKGYITAQEGRQQPDNSLQGDLLRARRALANGQPPPLHLYSHITGTRLRSLLDQVDAAAALSAKGYPATVGWLAPHTEPRICYPHGGLQVQDALPHACRGLLITNHASSRIPIPQCNPALAEYSTTVVHSLLALGDHMATTSLPPPPPPGHPLRPRPPAHP